MSPWILIILAIAISVSYFAIFWIIQYLINDSGVVDVGWGASVALIGVFFCAFTDGNPTRRWIAAMLITAWAIRLSVYLYLRWRKHPEDARYAALKKKWGASAQLRMFRFYQMQGLGSVLFALPLLCIGFNQAELGWFDGLGILIWIVSVVGEAVADHQLHRFRQDPANRGEVCNQGLWRFSRHPNYFFEWLHWWTYVCFAITAPLGWLTVVCPVAMWFFLNRVTGIPLTEIQAIKSRGDKYRAYQSTTSAFFPWFPKTTTELNG